MVSGMRTLSFVLGALLGAGAAPSAAAQVVPAPPPSIPAASAPAASPASRAAPPRDGLDEAVRLGRLLYAYDRAAWHGTDAVRALLPADPARLAERMTGYVAEPHEGGWRVVFGRLSPDSSALDVAYEALLDSAYAVRGARALDPAERRTGAACEAFWALGRAKGAFVPPERVQYNSAVVPVGDGAFLVYFLPAQPAARVYLVGADVRFAAWPRERRLGPPVRLHAGLVPMDLRRQTGPTLSTAVLTAHPVETDVFYALSRPDAPGRLPRHVVVAEDWAFLIDGTGAIEAVPAADLSARLSARVAAPR